MLNSEKIWKTWKKRKLKCELIWKNGGKVSWKVKRCGKCAISFYLSTWFACRFPPILHYYWSHHQAETRAIPFLLSSIWGQLKSHLRTKKETQHVNKYNLLQNFNVILNTEISIILHWNLTHWFFRLWRSSVLRVFQPLTLLQHRTFASRCRRLSSAPK
jgi:hypothetical protein